MYYHSKKKKESQTGGPLQATCKSGLHSEILSQAETKQNKTDKMGERRREGGKEKIESINE